MPSAVGLYGSAEALVKLLSEPGNFGQGGRALHRQPQGEKQMAFRAAASPSPAVVDRNALA